MKTIFDLTYPISCERIELHMGPRGPITRLFIIDDVEQQSHILTLEALPEKTALARLLQGVECLRCISMSAEESGWPEGGRIKMEINYNDDIDFETIQADSFSFHTEK